MIVNVREQLEALADSHPPAARVDHRAIRDALQACARSAHEIERAMRAVQANAPVERNRQFIMQLQPQALPLPRILTPQPFHLLVPATTSARAGEAYAN